MNFEKLQQLLNGETVKVGWRNNQIYCQNGIFVVEFFEFTSEKEGDMFSTGPDFFNVEEAIEVAND